MAILKAALWALLGAGAGILATLLLSGAILALTYALTLVISYG